MVDDDVYRGPCRCSRCLAWKFDNALELLDAGDIRQASKDLKILRWQMALKVEEMECMWPRGQLQVRVVPIPWEEYQRRKAAKKAEAKRRRNFPGLKVVA